MRRSERRGGYLDRHGNLVVAPDSGFEENWGVREAMTADDEAPSDGPHVPVVVTLTWRKCDASHS